MMTALQQLRKPKSFVAALEEAVRLRREVMSRPRFNDIRDERPTARRCIAIACKNAGLTTDQLATLDAHVAANGSNFPWASRFVEAVYHGMVAVRPDAGADSHPITNGLHHRMGVTPETFVGVRVDASALGTTPHGLVAVGIRRAALEHPTAFGLIDDVDAHEREQREQQARIDGLTEKLVETFTLAETEFEQLDERTGAGILRWKQAPAVKVKTHQLRESIGELIAAIANPQEQPQEEYRASTGRRTKTLEQQERDEEEVQQAIRERSAEQWRSRHGIPKAEEV